MLPAMLLCIPIGSINKDILFPEIVCVLALAGISIEISSLLDIIIYLSRGIFKPLVGKKIIKISVFIGFLAGNLNTS